MTSLLTLMFSALAAVMLFLHGLAAFSEEVSRLGGERLRDALRRLTRTDWRGAVVGACVTAVVQWSSAVTSMAVALAHNRTLTARGTFAVMMGANVGTTSTALLASSAMDARANKLALLNTGFNLLGVLLFATELQPVVHMILATDMAPASMVALVHTVFNLAAAAAALVLLPHVWPRLGPWVDREN